MIKRDLLKPRKHITSKHAQWRCTVPDNNPNPSGDLLRHFWKARYRAQREFVLNFHLGISEDDILARHDSISESPYTHKLPSDLLSHAIMATSRTCICSYIL